VTFQKASETLEQIQKELEDYLAMKQMAFPRFYFLSNDELLEILAQSKNVQAVQPHMSKCFDGIKSLDFGDEPGSINIWGMISAEDEHVPLGNNLKARGGMETWLAAVELEMQRSLARLAKEAYRSYEAEHRTDWVTQQPAQLALVVSQIYWVAGVERAFEMAGSAMADYFKVRSMLPCQIG
jgi:dynein heavy chain, axonemal